MNHWKSEFPDLKKRCKSAINNEINLTPCKFNGPITSIKQTEKIKFNDKYFKEGAEINPDSKKTEDISGSSEDDEMTIEEQKTSDFNIELDTIIYSMSNKPEVTQFKHLKGFISQSKEIISEKILISGKNKAKATSAYIDYNMMLNSPSAMADEKENSSPQIKK
ncbi:hypothetical protein AYI68_g6147 [Smittium mucronatum]|uniref:Uncharacterized protein n=1 Tax=Smittium mucronatum TaxID=133383 RepID=A0A1R0GSA1_9FUNG|nr:hypothetical protein AYI68_g6147 [Smittium mucronatum]